MIKLVKHKSTEWRGNGMGNAAAVWFVKGADHLMLWKGSTEWNITNLETDERIGRWLDTRQEAVLYLEALISEGQLSI